jgi:hypothetical protein
VHMNWTVDTRSYLPRALHGELNSLPRIGLELTLPKAMQQCIWFGRCAIPRHVGVAPAAAAPCTMHDHLKQTSTSPWAAQAVWSGMGGGRFAQHGLLLASCPAHRALGFQAHKMRASLLA